MRKGFVFASLLDRPLVPFIMLGLWYWTLFPAILAAAFWVAGFLQLPLDSLGLAQRPWLESPSVG